MELDSNIDRSILEMQLKRSEIVQTLEEIDMVLKFLREQKEDNNKN